MNQNQVDKYNNFELEEKAWEKRLGVNTEERVKNLGRYDREYRSNLRFSEVDEESQIRHNKYIHAVGADILRGKISAEKELQLEIEKRKKKEVKVGKLLKRKIKVTDLDDGGVAITMDQEWDTSTWSNDLIEAGCEALILVFYDPATVSSLERKERAVEMLQKLLYRHKVAQTYIRKNIEMMIGKAANKQIRHGKSWALLDLLYILNSCKSSYITEMSQNNFNGKAFEMLLQEARLAAILIQHTFRSSKNKSKIRASTSNFEGFGSNLEKKMSKLGVINARSQELRFNWRLLHWNQSNNSRNMVGGQRGPIHIGIVYVDIVLDIVLYMVSPEAGSLAQGNREDVIRSNGCIFLSTFVANPTNKLSFMAVKILSNISKVTESFQSILQSGCVDSILRMIKYLRVTIGIGKYKLKKKKLEKVSPQEAYMASIDLLVYTASHVAGMYRAERGYRFLREAHEEVEKINYKQVLENMLNREVLIKDINFYFGSPSLLQELSLCITQFKDHEIIYRILMALLNLSSSYCYSKLIQEVTAKAALLMIRLIDLMNNKDDSIGTVCLSIFMQLSCTGVNREIFWSSKISQHIFAYRNYKSFYSMNDRPHLRNIMLAVCICRSYDYRLFDPQLLTSSLTNEEGSLRKEILREILRIIKCKHIEDEKAEDYSIADFSILETDRESAEFISKKIAYLSPHYLSDFLCCPENENYYESIPLEESSSICEIIEALFIHEPTALKMFSKALILFICKYLYLCKYLFLGKSMTRGQVLVLLNGVNSAISALSLISKACLANFKFGKELIETFREAELINSNLFFTKTLSIDHPKLDENTKSLQKRLGLTTIQFLMDFSQLTVSMEEFNKPGYFRDLLGAGQTVVELFTQIRKVHKKSGILLNIFDLGCGFLYQYTKLLETTYVAIQEWRIFEYLIKYLPLPLSGLLEEEVDEEFMIELTQESQENLHRAPSSPERKRKRKIYEYKIELEELPSSFFNLCANLCKIDEGIQYCLTDGYLRRSLDKLFILSKKYLSSHFDSEISSWPQDRLKFMSCLNLISMSANYSNPKFGSCNDLILYKTYHIIKICKQILHFHLPRDDRLIILSYLTISKLCQDTYRVNKLVESNDIFSVLIDEIDRLKEFPQEGAALLCEIIHFSCQGLTSQYIVSMIGKLRGPLSKLLRLFPAISNKIREANWTLTKSALVYKKTIDSSLVIEEDTGLAIEEFIRTGSLSKLELASLEFASLNNIPTDLEKDELSKADSNMDNLDSNDKFKDSIDEDQDPPKYGTYMYCGVSNCGSLRLNEHAEVHGSKRHLSEKESAQELFTLKDLNSESRLPASNLSARGNKKLIEQVKLRKSQSGLVEKQKSEFYFQAPQDSFKSSSSPFSEPPKLYSPTKQTKSLNISFKYGSGSKKAKKLYDFEIKSPEKKIQSITINELPQLLLTKPK